MEVPDRPVRPTYTAETMPKQLARPALPVRAAVIGSGGISKEHLGFLSGRLPGRDEPGSTAERIRLVGVADLSPAAAGFGAERYGADRAYTDVAELLADAEPDVVHVLTPPQTHVELTTQCLEAGAHVICEKPITTTTEDLEQLLTVAQQVDRVLTESHNYRFNRGVVTLRNAIDRGDLGQVREVEIRIALPVTDPDGRFGDPNLPSPIHDLPAGVIHDFTTHFTSVLLHLTGPVEFTRIGAAWSNHGGNPLFRYDNLDAILVGDGANGPIHGRLRFDAHAGPDAFAVRVHGTTGWAETDLFQPYNRTVVPRSGGAQLSPIINHVVNGLSLVNDGVRNVGRKLLQQTPYEGLHLMLDRTYDALIDGRQPPVTAEDMLATSRLVARLLSEEARL